MDWTQILLALIAATSAISVARLQTVSHHARRAATAAKASAGSADVAATAAGEAAELSRPTGNGFAGEMRSFRDEFSRATEELRRDIGGLRADMRLDRDAQTRDRADVRGLALDLQKHLQEGHRL